MLVLGPEPGHEGRLWATSRSRVPVDGAAIANDVRESSCREHRHLTVRRDGQVAKSILCIEGSRIETWFRWSSAVSGGLLQVKFYLKNPYIGVV
ncbi:hypothetical protein AVEN_220950-1 [Araneus ventricosus]|uniref:Uncharacterized protein n=1 Tax=Araneus ventricosus TaxID=182803 RepID=A0A4Y2H8M8_ARAVE|nr:hypothetical protein AVEN_220950-1 [Araneus ventricosus]